MVAAPAHGDDVIPAADPATAGRAIEGVVGRFAWRDYTLAYETRGTGNGDPFVLIHGLLLPSWVNGEIATRLAARGHRVILFDLLGHGRSDKPLHASEHRLEYAGEQVVALLDHLGVRRAVIGGMSLGANVSLEVAIKAPDRVSALVCEMPVLERGTVGVMLTLFPLLLALRFGGRPLASLFGLVKRLPRTAHEAFDAMLDTGDDPRAMAAVMHGYTAGPVCPPAAERARIEVPVLVIGHGRDWMHPLNDAEALMAELPHARLVRANHFFELRTRPDRLMAEIIEFVDAVAGGSGAAAG
jgi:pimeloyl-ACP methyl ester carboxylesterase